MKQYICHACEGRESPCISQVPDDVDCGPQNCLYNGQSDWSFDGIMPKPADAEMERASELRTDAEQLVTRRGVSKPIVEGLNMGTKQKDKCPECGRMKHLIRAHLFCDPEDAEKGYGGFYAKMCQKCADKIPEYC